MIIRLYSIDAEAMGGLVGRFEIPDDTFMLDRVFIYLGEPYIHAPAGLEVRCSRCWMMEQRAITIDDSQRVRPVPDPDDPNWLDHRTPGF